MTDHKPLTKETFFRNVHDAKRTFSSIYDVRGAVEGLKKQLQDELDYCWESEDKKIAYRVSIAAINNWFPVFAEEKQ